MKKFYDVKLKISATHRVDSAEFMKVEENADCVAFDSSIRKVMTYDRICGDMYVRNNVYELPRGNIYKIEIEFKP